MECMDIADWDSGMNATYGDSSRRYSSDPMKNAAMRQLVEDFVGGSIESRREETRRYVDSKRISMYEHGHKLSAVPEEDGELEEIDDSYLTESPIPNERTSVSPPPRIHRNSEDSPILSRNRSVDEIEESSSRKGTGNSLSTTDSKDEDSNTILRTIQAAQANQLLYSHKTHYIIDDRGDNNISPHANIQHIHLNPNPNTNASAGTCTLQEETKELLMHQKNTSNEDHAELVIEEVEDLDINLFQRKAMTLSCIEILPPRFEIQGDEVGGEVSAEGVEGINSDGEKEILVSNSINHNLSSKSSALVSLYVYIYIEREKEQT